MKFNKKGSFEFGLGETGKVILVLVIFLAAILAVIIIYFGPYLMETLKSINFW